MLILNSVMVFKKIKIAVSHNLLLTGQVPFLVENYGDMFPWIYSIEFSMRLVDENAPWSQLHPQGRTMRHES